MSKIKNSIIRNSIVVIVLLFLLLPVASFAIYKLGDPLIPCSNSAASSEGMVTPPGVCDFNAFLALINNVIQLLLLYMAVPIAAIMMAYAGFLLVTAGGAEAKTKAKSIFTDAVLGLMMAAGAWLIVRTILGILGYKGDWIGF